MKQQQQQLQQPERIRYCPILYVLNQNACGFDPCQSWVHCRRSLLDCRLLSVLDKCLPARKLVCQSREAANENLPIDQLGISCGRRWWLKAAASAELISTDGKDIH